MLESTSDQTAMQNAPIEPDNILEKNDAADGYAARMQTSTPTHSQDDDSSNDSLTLQIVLPPSQKKRKSKPCDINKEIEDHIRKELAKNPRKTSLTVKKVKSILKYVIGNESVLDMVSSSMKNAGQDLEPKLTRSKARQLRKENQIVWPLSPIQQPKPVDNEHLVLIREELPEEEDDDEYRPTNADLLEQSDDESGRQSVGTPSLNVSTASKYLANFNPDLLDDVAQDSPVKVDLPPVTQEPIISFKKPVENIGQRTRSKFSLSSTPLETIEQAFIPPDITTDMYDFHCDNQEWENFLKEFMQPLSNDTADVDEEDDPEYNVIEDEELYKEELRRDNAVTVPRSELKTLMMELLDGIEDFSSDDETAKPTSAPSPSVVATICENPVAKDSFRKESEVVEHEVSSVNCPRTVSPPQELIIEVNSVRLPRPASPAEELVIGVTLPQRLLLLQQLRQHVQLLTQNFLQTYQHPQFHKHSSQCKQFLVELAELGKFNPDSAINVVNLTKAVSLTDYWEKFLSSSEGSEVISFYENQSQAAQSAKKWKRVHKNTFHPHLIETIMHSDVFIYPNLLPMQPFRCDNPSRLEFAKSEDHLIAMGLEQFIPYVQKYPQWYGVRQSDDRVAVDLTHQHLLTAKTTMQILRRMRALKDHEGNPISHFFKYGNTIKMIHHVAPLDESQVVPPIKQNPTALGSCWKEYYEVIRSNKEKEGN